MAKRKRELLQPDIADTTKFAAISRMSLRCAEMLLRGETALPAGLEPIIYGLEDRHFTSERHASCAVVARCFIESAMPHLQSASKTNINVLPCRLASKPEYKFVVTGPRPGGRRRWRKFFAVKAQAEAYAHLRKVELANVGTQGAALTQSQRAEYIDCVKELEPYNVSLREAIKILVPTLAARRQSVSLETAVSAMIAAQKEDGASGRHIEDLRSRLGQLQRAFPGRLLATISSIEIDDWLRGLSVANITRNNFRRVVGSLFAFGCMRKWCAENPISAVSKTKVKGGKIGILSPQQIARLLTNAPADMVPALAIGAFAGLRRAEIERLDWSEIRLKKNLIEVAAAKSKTAARRFVPIRANLASWLASFVHEKGPVCPSNYQVHLTKAREAAGLSGKNWPKNALRHSFASYHAARFQDAGKLAAEMGHTTPAIVFQHYRELVEPREASRYWKVYKKGGQ